MTRFDQWFSTVFLGAAAPMICSMILTLLLPLWLPSVSPGWLLLAGLVLGVILDCTLLRHLLVMAYVCSRYIIMALTLVYSAWFMLLLRGWPALNLLVPPAVAWVLGRRRRLNDQTREQLRASLTFFTPWILAVLAISFAGGITLAHNDAAFVSGMRRFFGVSAMEPWLVCFILGWLGAALLLAEYFLMRFVARKSYDHLFIAPISSL